VVVCGLLVAGAAGLPGGGPPDGVPFVPDNGTTTPGTPESGPVTPVGGGPVDTPTGTAGTPTGESDPGLAILGPCPDDLEAPLPTCLFPDPVTVTHDADVLAGSNTTINVTFENTYATNVTTALIGVGAPPGWDVRIADPLDGTSITAGNEQFVEILEVEPDETRTVSWELSPPDTAHGGRYNVTVAGEWELTRYENSTIDAGYFTFRENTTYRVTPSECAGVDPCSLLANDPNGSEPFGFLGAEVGETDTTTGHLVNPYGESITGWSVSLDSPSSAWRIGRPNATAPAAPPPGGSTPITYSLSVPDSADCGREYTIDGTAVYQVGGDSLTVPFTVPVVTASGGDDCDTASVREPGGVRPRGDTGVRPE
jgi:hypothetical protein